MLRIYGILLLSKAYLVAPRVKNLSAMREMWVQSLDQEDPLEEVLLFFLLNRDDRARVCILFCRVSKYKSAMWAILLLLKLFNSIVEITQFYCSLKA